MKWYSIAATLVAPSQAALRFGCSTLSIQRLDPLVEPGHIPSAHVHQVRFRQNVYCLTLIASL